MPDANEPKDANQPPPRPPKVFPDLATCRVQDMGYGGFWDCLSPWAGYCPHVLSFGHGYFCRHPSARELLARSAVTKDKPA